MGYEAINDKAAPHLSYRHWPSCLAGEEFHPAGFIVVESSLVLNAGQKLKIVAPESFIHNITNDSPANGKKCQKMISNK